MRSPWLLLVSSVCWFRLGFLVIFICILSVFSTTSHGQTCNSDDRLALLDFSIGLDFGIKNWTSSSNCCDWPGVRCEVSPSSSSSRKNSSGSDSRVVGLDVGNWGLSGRISASLGGLARLRTLNLSRNSLVGPFPPDLFRLRQLEVLDLSRNLFSGELSVGIGNLSRLTDLVISYNNFSGEVNEGIGKLSHLTYLDVSFNSFSGELGMVVGNLSHLTYLDVSFNNFSGELGLVIGNLSHLTNVFGGVTRLEHLFARANFFTGLLPASLSSFSMLGSLDFGENSLSGSIDLNFTGLSRLVVLRLDSNRFDGPIPENLFSCKDLQVLNLAKNNLSGQISRSFTNLLSLSSLSLLDNHFSYISRALVILQECRNLTILDLGKNFYGEKMPDSGIQGFESLKALVIANCGLSGLIPRWLMSLAKLRLLDLSGNNLIGGVPPWIGSFNHLFYLDMSNNSLTGEIPVNLTRLKILNLKKAVYDSSPIEFPFYMKRNRSMEVRFSRFSSIPSTLDLSNNSLNGPLWKDFGNLKQLQVLDLSKNIFSGSIPSELSGMVSLETLDLSFNNLSGSIPVSLVKLTFLSMFSIANNHLQGRVPVGPQFDSFPLSSFVGNPGLCGRPLVNPCYLVPSPFPPSPTNNTDREDTKITFRALPYGIGVVSGFIPTFIICLVYCKCYRKHKKIRRD